MIFLQSSLFLGAFFLPFPLVIIAHICGLHSIILFFKPNYSTFSIAKKVLFGLAFLFLILLAIIAIPFWSYIFGLLTLISSKYPIISLIGFPICIIGLVLWESKNIYHQFYKHKFETFSCKFFGLSILISIISFSLILGLVWFAIKGITFEGT